MGPLPTREVEVTTGLQDGSVLADELLQRIGQTVGDKANVSTVFGEPVEREGITAAVPESGVRESAGGSCARAR